MPAPIRDTLPMRSSVDGRQTSPSQRRLVNRSAFSPVTTQPAVLDEPMPYGLQIHSSRVEQQLKTSALPAQLKQKLYRAGLILALLQILLSQSFLANHCLILHLRLV